MFRCAGERDIEVQEIMRQVLELKLYRNSFQVVTVTLDSSKRCSFSSHNIQVEKLESGIYGGRNVFSHSFKGTLMQI